MLFIVIVDDKLDDRILTDDEWMLRPCGGLSLFEEAAQVSARTVGLVSRGRDRW